MESLRHLVKQVEKATQVRRSGLDVVLADLKEHRVAMGDIADPDLRAATTFLCNSLTRFLQDATPYRTRELQVAVESIKPLLPQEPRRDRAAKSWFRR